MMSTPAARPWSIWSALIVTPRFAAAASTVDTDPVMASRRCVPYPVTTTGSRIAAAGTSARFTVAAPPSGTVLGFLGVPLAFAPSPLLPTSLHPDIAGPGANPDAAVGATVGWILLVSVVAFLALFLHLWLARLRLVRLEERIEALETS